MNGSPAPLLYVGPTQINLQLPPELTGSEASLAVRSKRSLKYDQNLKPANVKSTTCAYFFVTEQAISATY